MISMFVKTIGCAKHFQEYGKIVFQKQILKFNGLGTGDISKIILTQIEACAARDNSNKKLAGRFSPRLFRSELWNTLREFSPLTQAVLRRV